MSTPLKGLPLAGIVSIGAMSWAAPAAALEPQCDVEPITENPILLPLAAIASHLLDCPPVNQDPPTGPRPTPPSPPFTPPGTDPLPNPGDPLPSVCEPPSIFDGDSTPCYVAP